MTDANLERITYAALNAVLERVLRQGAPLTMVDSPPGAGKTWLVLRILALATVLRLRVICTTNTNSQARDLVRRLAAFQLPSLAHLVSEAERPNADPRISQVVTDPSNLPVSAGVTVTTLKKALHSLDRLGPSAFHIAVVDESYQASGSDLLAALALSQRFVLVGDPGQLDPVITTDTSPFETNDHRVHRPAPRYLIDIDPGRTRDIIRLPATRRLVQDTVEFVQPAFYPDLPFASLAGERRLRATIAAAPADFVDGVIAAIERGASIVQVILPPAPPRFVDFDPEIPQVAARIVNRFRRRGVAFSDGRLVSDGDFGCIDSNVASGESLRQSLRAVGRGAVAVDTPERWQGLQCPIVVAKHPLTEMHAGVQFSFAPGRWCVSLSRHTHACIVVARANVGERLDRYIHSVGEAACTAPDAAWRGFYAHKQVWDALASKRRNVLAA
jgi:hypothetical protein